MATQQTAAAGFLQRLHVEVKGLSPQAANMVREVDIVGQASKQRGLYKKHLLKGTRVWGGSFWHDFWINFCNAHPAFGILLSHPKHPLSGKERFIILTFELLLKLFVAGIFAAAEEEGDDAAIVNMIESILVALLTTVFSAVLVFIATCDDRFLGDSVGGMLRCFLSSLSACGLCFAWFFMLMLGSVGVVLVATGENSDFGDYMVVTAQSLGWSWFVVWPLVNGLLLFGFGRWREQRSLAKKGAKTADGIDRETLIWWETNEFPPDVDVIVSDEKTAAAGTAPAAPAHPRLEVEAEQAAVAPGNQPVPSVQTAAHDALHASAVVPTGASFALGGTPSPAPGPSQV